MRNAAGQQESVEDTDGGGDAEAGAPTDAIGHPASIPAAGDESGKLGGLVNAKHFGANVWFPKNLSSPRISGFRRMV